MPKIEDIFPEKTHDISLIKEGTCIGITHNDSFVCQKLNLPQYSVIEQDEDGFLFVLMNDGADRLNINKNLIEPYYDTDLDSNIIKNVFILQPFGILISCI
jgi:hypothetical protein